MGLYTVLPRCFSVLSRFPLHDLETCLNYTDHLPVKHTHERSLSLTHTHTHTHTHSYLPYLLIFSLLSPVSPSRLTLLSRPWLRLHMSVCSAGWSIALTKLWTEPNDRGPPSSASWTLRVLRFSRLGFRYFAFSLNLKRRQFVLFRLKEK